jgi:hypothetical protein
LSGPSLREVLASSEGERRPLSKRCVEKGFITDFDAEGGVS